MRNKDVVVFIKRMKNVSAIRNLNIHLIMMNIITLEKDGKEAKAMRRRSYSSSYLPMLIRRKTYQNKYAI